MKSKDVNYHRASFFSLPVEIRLLVYSYLFESTIQLLGNLPGILKTSKTIYLEAIALYYTLATFIFWANPQSLEQNLQIYCNLPTKYKNLIRSLRYATIFPASTNAATALVPLNQAWQIAAEKSIALPPGLLQVRVRRRVESGDEEIVWTSDPEALFKKWTT